LLQADEVVANIADDRGEFRHMRRVRRRHLTQRSARSDDVFYSLRASRQLLIAITQQRYTVSQAGLTLIYALRRGRHQVAIFAHRRVGRDARFLQSVGLPLGQLS
jgi:hypothetical protein